jgi:hypothetical protein
MVGLSEIGENMATTRREVLCAAGSLFAAALARARSQEKEPLQVTYYYLPG